MVNNRKAIKDSVHLHILITKKQSEALNKRAEKLGLTVSSLIRLMIDDKMVER